MEHDSLSDLGKSLRPGLYQHFKGGEYRVIAVARHSEQRDEEFVVYESLKNRSIWIRPLVMFTETVERDDYKGPRFKYMGQLEDSLPNIYAHWEGSPTHISVGAVVLNNKQEVLVHFWKNISPGVIGFSGENIYLLMRETVERNESLEQAVGRGLMEEFGATAQIIDYLGAIVSQPPSRSGGYEKTTLYFECRLKDIDLSLRKKDDPEFGSEVSFQNIDFLISHMKGQGEKYNRTDIDESKILKFLKKKLI